MPRCDLVVTGPAGVVAIAYDPARATVPRIVALGRGMIGTRIEAAAVARGVAVLERPGLARSLARRGRVGQRVPAELYQAVAEALAVVARRTGRDADDAGGRA